jgi:hypothetical protein
MPFGNTFINNFLKQLNANSVQPLRLAPKSQKSKLGADR